MCWEAAQAYPGDSRSPYLARRFCREELGKVLADAPGRADVLDDAEVVVSELVTNAVAAGSHAVYVALALHREWLRLTVEDDAPGEPHPTRASPRDQGGRGLRVVDALTGRWGTTVLDTGKQVWAEFPLLVGLVGNLACEL